MLPSFLLALFSRESLPGQRWQYRRTTCSRKASLFQRCRHHLFPSLCSILSTLWTFHYEKKDPFELNSTNITMSSAPGNIFLTTENLAFSLPLILVCGSYAYFKYVPLYIGLPILGGIAILYQISAQIKAQRDKKLDNMDDKTMNDLALELEGDDKASETKEAEAKKLAKKKAAIQRRLEAEAKKENKKGKKKGADDDDEDDVALDTFVRGTKKKN